MRADDRFLINLPMGLLGMWLAWRFVPELRKGADRHQSLRDGAAIELGLPVVLCTDNRLMSSTTLTDEYVHAAAALGFGFGDLAEIAVTGFDAAFLPYREREALARDKTRTQVFDISELGLVEMTRKRIGEGLLESFTQRCPDCEDGTEHLHGQGAHVIGLADILHPRHDAAAQGGCMGRPGRGGDVCAMDTAHIRSMLDGQALPQQRAAQPCVLVSRGGNNSTRSPSRTPDTISMNCSEKVPTSTSRATLRPPSGTYTTWRSPI